MLAIILIEKSPNKAVLLSENRHSLVFVTNIEKLSSYIPTEFSLKQLLLRTETSKYEIFVNCNHSCENSKEISKTR